MDVCEVSASYANGDRSHDRSYRVKSLLLPFKIHNSRLLIVQSAPTIKMMFRSLLAESAQQHKPPHFNKSWIRMIHGFKATIVLT